MKTEFFETPLRKVIFVGCATLEKKGLCVAAVIARQLCQNARHKEDRRLRASEGTHCCERAS